MKIHKTYTVLIFIMISSSRMTASWASSLEAVGRANGGQTLHRGGPALPLEPPLVIQSSNRNSGLCGCSLHVVSRSWNSSPCRHVIFYRRLLEIFLFSPWSSRNYVFDCFCFSYSMNVVMFCHWNITVKYRTEWKVSHGMSTRRKVNSSSVWDPFCQSAESNFQTFSRTIWLIGSLGEAQREELLNRFGAGITKRDNAVHASPTGEWYRSSTKVTKLNYRLSEMKIGLC